MDDRWFRLPGQQRHHIGLVDVLWGMYQGQMTELHFRPGTMKLIGGKMWFPRD